MDYKHADDMVISADKPLHRFASKLTTLCSNVLQVVSIRLILSNMQGLCRRHAIVWFARRLRQASVTHGGATASYTCCAVYIKLHPLAVCPAEKLL